MPDTKRFKEESTPNKTKLTMTKVVRSDSGKYTLNLKNELGEATFNLEVVVIGEENWWW